MKKGIVLLFSLLSIGLGNLFSQQTLVNASAIVSPEINIDNTVTFSLQASDAKSVKLVSDFVQGEVEMVKNESGLWSYTTDVLPSDLYQYAFSVDGVRCLDPNNVYVIRDVATMFNIFIVDGGKADNYSVNRLPHGTLSYRWYASLSNEITPRRLTIYTPSGYELNHEDYPVLYLLHGMGGDEEAWITLGRTVEILDNLIGKGLAKPMIVVMPNGNAAQEAAPGKSWLGLYKPSTDLPHTMDGKFEEIFPDIMNFIENNYRVKRNKSGRAIAGLSMGGFHSLHISRYYPNTFDYIGLFSPAVNPRGETNSKIYEAIDVSLEKQKDNKYKLYWIGIGKNDFLYSEVSDYRAKLDSINMPYVYHESEGGHTWTNWRDYLCTFLPQLFR